MLKPEPFISRLASKRWWQKSKATSDFEYIPSYIYFMLIWFKTRKSVRFNLYWLAPYFFTGKSSRHEATRCISIRILAGWKKLCGNALYREHAAKERCKSDGKIVAVQSSSSNPVGWIKDLLKRKLSFYSCEKKTDRFIFFLQLWLRKHKEK